MYRLQITHVRDTVISVFCENGVRELQWEEVWDRT